MEIIEIWKKAVSLLPKNLGSQFQQAKFIAGKEHDGQLIFKFRKTTVSYEVIYIPELTQSVMLLLEKLTFQHNAPEGKKTLVITKTAYPKIANRLIEMGINFADAVGNIYIDHPELYLMKAGLKKKDKIKKETKNRLFSESGIKLLFGILHNPAFLDLSYREMADAANISAASTAIILKELQENDYLHEGQQKKRVLNGKKELLDRWALAYADQLKPKITRGHYDSRALNLLKSYKKINPENWDGLWSGEAAANLYTNFLSPSKVSMFVLPGSTNWMGELKLVPVEEQGDIEVMEFFWNIHHPIFQHGKIHPRAVPPVLVYAELITSSDSRNLETATKLFDEYLQFNN